MASALAKIGTLALGFGLTGSLATADGSYRGYEMPPFTVEAQLGAAEIRAYAPHLLAEVTVAGDRDAALGQGFSMLARYIFGANDGGGKVAMTVPVAQRPGTPIAMTAPVTQRGGDDVWTVSFMMPAGFTRDTLPRPDNDAIRFVETAADRQIVLTFSGRGTGTNLTAHEAELRAIAAAAGLDLGDGPFFYFYDDPFTLPWNRRNEVAFRLR
jgi:hypothetical protein